MSLNRLPYASQSIPSPKTDLSDPFSTLGKQYTQEEEGYGIDKLEKTRVSRTISTGTSEAQPFSMRIPIRVQLGLLVLLTSTLALAVISIATWVYTWNFVANIKSQGLTLAASLKAAQIASDLRLIQTTCSTIVTRILIQQSLVSFYSSGATVANWSAAITDVTSALASGGYSNLLQVIIYPRNNTGNDHGLLNVTASTLSAPIVLPYQYDNGSSVHLGDPGRGYPAALYPNLTYVPRYTNDETPDVYAFPDYRINRTSVLVLGPLTVNATFSMISMTLNIINGTSKVLLGYMTVLADASAITGELLSRDGLGETGATLLIGPNRPDNLFASNVNFSSPAALSNTPVNYVFPPPPLVTDDRHSQYDPIYGGPAFNMSAYPAVLDAFESVTSNNSADLSTTNEQGTNVAVGWSRLDVDNVDWILLVEQGHDEAWQPVTQLRKILLACVFGTIGFIMLLTLPVAYMGVLPITRLKEATMASVAPDGETDRDSQDSQFRSDDDDYIDEENVHRRSTPKPKSGLIVRMRDLTRRRRRTSHIDKVENARRRAFKIPAKVQDKKHYITDELTELTSTFNEMSTELTMQYSRLEERVIQRTRELEISKKAAEAANESKTLFIANISHELKTPLNGILGMAAVCMGESDINKIKQSLQVVYKSGDLLLHLLNDLLTFSKNQIGQSLTLEEKEFALRDIRSQLVHIFDKQVREGQINFSVNYLPTVVFDSMDGTAQQNVFTAQSVDLPALGPSGTGRLKDMRLWGDQHRILQVIINLVSNSLKFTPEHGTVDVRIRCLGDVERSPARSDGVNTNRSSTASASGSRPGSKDRKPRGRHTYLQRSGSDSYSTISRAPSSQDVGRPMGTALLINPMDPKAAQMHIQVRERAPTPPPANARVLLFEFSVSDTGPGMSAALQERVFEPFVQGDLGLNRKFGGTGLGLSICSQLATLMGGHITLKSEEGVGSTFTMQIPLKFVDERPSSVASSPHRTSSERPRIRLADTPVSDAQEGRARNGTASLTVDTAAAMADNGPRLIGLSQPFFAKSPTAAKQTHSASEGPKSTDEQMAALDRVAAKDVAPGSKIRVLVAEDNLVNQEVVRRMLKLEDVYDVTIAKDGQEAYEMVKASMETGPVFNLIFMDIQMPKLDGLQSTRLIRQMGFSAPIVALTAFAEESNVKECMESGMDMFLSKPIRRPALKQVLKKFAPIPEETDDAPSSPNGGGEKSREDATPQVDSKGGSDSKSDNVRVTTTAVSP